jgi:hypothetical protein
MRLWVSGDSVAADAPIAGRNRHRYAVLARDSVERFSSEAKSNMTFDRPQENRRRHNAVAAMIKSLRPKDTCMARETTSIPYR